MKVELLEEYRFIDSQFFDDLFDAEEVVDICLEADMDPIRANVFVKYWLEKHGRADTFKITCDDAMRFFSADGKLKMWLVEQELKEGNL